MSRSRRQLACDACRLVISDGEPVVFALQSAGSGPYPGQSGWYVAEAHEQCAREFVADYQQRPCRGCLHLMYVRGGRRRHCSDRCRHVDFKRREKVRAEALAAGHVMYLNEARWLTRPEVASVENGTAAPVHQPSP